MSDASAPADSGQNENGKTSGSEDPNTAPAGDDKTEGSAASGLGENWRGDLANGLDQDVHDSFIKYAERYTSPTEFAKGVVDLRKSHDSRVQLPDDNTKPEDAHKFFTRLGKPNEAKDYTFNHIEDAPELNDVEVEAREGFRGIAHDLNLTQKQVDGLVRWNDEQRKLVTDGFDQSAKNFADTTIADLKSEWGPDFDKNVEFANTSRAEFGDTDFETFKNLRLSDGTIVGDHPALLKFMAKVGREIETDDERRVRHLHGTSDAEDIQAQIDAIEQEAIEKGKSTADAEYHRRLQPLYDQLHGKKPLTPVNGGYGAR